MKIGVVYATSNRHAWLTVEVAEGTTARQAIERSGILKQFPEIDLAVNKVGVFGKAVDLDTTLEDGARVEIYRPITADPKTVRRRPKPEAPAAG